MDFCRINKLVDTGLVEAFYTLKSWSNWPANEPDNIEGYEKAAEIFGITNFEWFQILQALLQERLQVLEREQLQVQQQE